ncbi:MAG: hypothetical protein RIM99_14765 [Cyclobacteriaceae bacterium]
MAIVIYLIFAAAHTFNTLQIENLSPKQSVDPQNYSSMISITILSLHFLAVVFGILLLLILVKGKNLKKNQKITI